MESALSPAPDASVTRRTASLAVLASACVSRGPAAAAATTNGTPILVYHRFDAATPGPTTVSVASFEAQLAWLEDREIQVAPLRTAVSALAAGERPASNQAALTVDDGHRSVYTVLLPLIRRRQIPVTLFIYPSAISNAAYAMTWDQLREARDTGLVEVQ